MCQLHITTELHADYLGIVEVLVEGWGRPVCHRYLPTLYKVTDSQMFPTELVFFV